MINTITTFELYCIVFGIGLLILFTVILVSMIVSLKKHPGNDDNKPIIGILIIAIILLLAGVYHTWTEPDVATHRQYFVSIEMTMPSEQQDNATLYLPLPVDYSSKYRNPYISIPFDQTGNKNNTSFIQNSIMKTSTDHGEILSVTANMSFRLSTSRHTYNSGKIEELNVDLTTQEGDKIYIYLSDTQANVTISFYFETEITIGFCRWETHYIALGNSPPNLENSYHDATICDLETTIQDFEMQRVPLESGWNELSIFKGSYTRST